MKSWQLVKNGKSETAFQIKELPNPIPQKGQIGIKVEAFGLNFADIMARLGLYQDCPKLPAIIGYDVVGHIDSIGEGVTGYEIGQRVTAMTRFGGYSTYAVTDYRAAAVISESMSLIDATSLAVQGCTAYYCSFEASRLHPGDYVLIHAAVGGVGSLLVQIALNQGAIVFGTTSSEEKIQMLKEMGVQYPINYKTQNFEKEIKNITNGKGLHAIYDPIGGSGVKKGYNLLSSGGTIVCFGGSELNEKTNIFSKLSFAAGFGIYSPIGLMQNSKTISGVNMLRIADFRPEILKHCFNEVVKLYDQKIIQPLDGKLFEFEQLAEAHNFLESRKSMGKIALKV